MDCRRSLKVESCVDKVPATSSVLGAERSGLAPRPSTLSVVNVGWPPSRSLLIGSLGHETAPTARSSRDRPSLVLMQSACGCKYESRKRSVMLRLRRLRVSRTLRILMAASGTRVQRSQSSRPSVPDGRVGRELKLPLTSAGQQRQTQFASSSPNGCDVTSNLSRHRWHSFLTLREFDQQLGLFFGPFAGFCGLHCCSCSTNRNRHQSVTAILAR
ncbi:hypothetical protein ABIA95_002727 [Bradyrhizobium sp. LA8.1]